MYQLHFEAIRHGLLFLTSTGDLKDKSVWSTNTPPNELLLGNSCFVLSVSGPHREALNEKSRQGIEEQRKADQDLQVREARHGTALHPKAPTREIPS